MKAQAFSVGDDPQTGIGAKATGVDLNVQFGVS